MATESQVVTIEGFVTDLAFLDRSKVISDVFTPAIGQVATLTPKVLTYFSEPATFDDRRAASTRTVNWSPTTSARVVFDKVPFSNFLNVLNNISVSAGAGFFKILDKLFFNYSPTNTRETLETYLTSDIDIGPIYVPDSFSLSQTLVSDTVYVDNASTKQVSVPSFLDITLKLTSGSTTVNYVLKLYASAEAWLNSYSISTVVKVIPALPYQKLYDASLVNSIDNIFSTASLTATLSRTTTQSLIGSVPVSGYTEYKAILVSGTNKVSVPFNLLYRGRKPTLFQIRNAIKQELADSGVGTMDGWKLRIPGVFVEGRFYVVPLWDEIYTKPDQKIFPNVMKYNTILSKTNKILSSLGYGNLATYLNVLTAYYNRMTLTAIPDLTGDVKLYHLSELIPDYQNCAPTDEQFAYMFNKSQDFSRDLNLILAVDSGVSSSTVFTPNTEGAITFYNFTVDSYEICVITKECYTSIMESIQ